MLYDEGVATDLAQAPCLAEFWRNAEAESSTVLASKPEKQERKYWEDKLKDVQEQCEDLAPISEGEISKTSDQFWRNIVHFAYEKLREDLDDAERKYWTACLAEAHTQRMLLHRPRSASEHLG
ncbi:hypothetical protein [Synechococcus sp. PCC 7336]|uniref:hypothetical protein n=1 Tax=Synechococcus sp. PCC 7336 TaxID=195250 RepID=UPI0003475B30|nr:hypothetical protein [Synechococcus sp. PCC 7336]